MEDKVNYPYLPRGLWVFREDRWFGRVFHIDRDCPEVELGVVRVKVETAGLPLDSDRVCDLCGEILALSDPEMRNWLGVSA